MTDESDYGWYVAIARFTGENHYSITAARSEFYRTFAETVRKQGIKVIAEEFDVNGKIMNRLDGFDENGVKASEPGLKVLIDKINSGENLGVKEELRRLVTAT